MAISKKSMLALGAVTTIGLGSLAGVTIVSAHSFGGESLAEKFATRFNLSQDEVQTFLDEEKETHKADMHQKFEERLNQAVSDGELTEDQKSKILAKHEELKSFHESLEGKTHEERREAMQTKHDEVQSWAEENDIPLELVRPFGGGHGHGGMKHF